MLYCLQSSYISSETNKILGVAIRDYSEDVVVLHLQTPSVPYLQARHHPHNPYQRTGARLQPARTLLCANQNIWSDEPGKQHELRRPAQLCTGSLGRAETRPKVTQLSVIRTANPLQRAIYRWYFVCQRHHRAVLPNWPGDAEEDLLRDASSKAFEEWKIPVHG